MVKIKILTVFALVSLMATPAVAAPVTLDILTDLWPDETYFEMIYDPAGVATPVAFDEPLIGDFSDGFADQDDFDLPSSNHHFEWDLAVGDYEWTIYDSWGDGICCGNGVGSYTLNTPGQVFIGGDFGSSETVCFSTAAPVPEPATMFLLGTGLVGLAGFKRKLKRSSCPIEKLIRLLLPSMIL